jgi:hypothetical protein
VLYLAEVQPGRECCAEIHGPIILTRVGNENPGL